MILRTRLLTVTTAVAAATSMMAATATLAADKLMAPPVNTLSPQQSSGLVATLTAMDAAHGLAPDLSFRLSSLHPGVVGQKIVRAQHTYKGLRVFGSESVIVTNAAGSIVSVSASDRRNKLGTGLAPSAVSDLVPTLSANDAITVAVNSIAPRGTHRWEPTAELLLYPIVKTERVPSAAGKPESELNALDLQEVVERYELAYYVKLRLALDGKPLYYDTVVNAKDGNIIAQWQALKTVVGTGNSQYNGVVPINTSQSGGGYQMLDDTRGTGGKYGGMAITNANHSSANNPDPGNIYTNSTNTWGDGQQYINGGSTTNANGQTAAVNALWGLMNTYDTNKNALGWHSLDGNNTATYIAAHVDTQYDNAFYDDSCKCMYIGDGDSFYSLGSIDVIGHEMSHGVTASTADLVYSGESGGLNESNSDIGGEMVEAYARNGGTGTTIPASGNDWMMGKEISKSGQPLRWLYKPSKDGRSPDAWSSSIKYLDVHYSSGPNNRMFYFLSQGSSSDPGSDYYSKYLVKSPAAMTGIGSDKAYRIWFKSLTTKFTSSTNYADARSKVLASAQELYGAGSKEVIAVTRAYAAINVGADVDESTTGGSDVTITTQPANVTVAPGATASFSVGASGGTQPYSYKWFRDGSEIAGANAPAYSLTAQASDNGATFNAVVSDASSPVKSATSAKAMLTVRSGGGTDLVTNGGFENGTTGWRGTTGVIGDFEGQSPYEGTRYAWLGGNGRIAVETLTQSVTIPASAASATLTYALHIDTDEVKPFPYDKLTVTVRSSTGSVLRTLATYTNLDAADGYQIRTFDLSAYKGRTVTLSFIMREDRSKQTSFVLDNVSLIAQ
ncbi:M4 family metallopeptidase [Rugamonas aquatica]|uniref:M4 family peptidase n=1 Tax=Rugamonas aquatica TaxID=2743357 RepID=A0A6A7N638_9BURK|nr:M4 family metallopeptidase [Rugamonas aquatica]MQA40506.1 M4 family peptidase [Rugamonas aquatica]